MLPSFPPSFAFRRLFRKSSPLTKPHLCQALTHLILPFVVFLSSGQGCFLQLQVQRCLFVKSFLASELKLFNIPVFCELSSMNFPSLTILLPFIKACLARREVLGHSWCLLQGFLLSLGKRGDMKAKELPSLLRSAGFYTLKPEVSYLEHSSDVCNDADCFPLHLPTACSKRDLFPRNWGSSNSL